MPIEATQPTVTDPIPSATYGLWWIQSFSVDGSNPANVTANVTLKKYRQLKDGSIDFSPLDADTVSIALNDVMTLATNDIHVGTIMATMLAHIQAYGRTLNLL